MSKYNISKRTRRHRFKRFLVGMVILVGILSASAVVIRHVYYKNLEPVSNSPKSQIVTIKSGLSVKQIANLLHSDVLIRNSWAFEWYVRSQALNSELQAGTYALTPNLTIPQIASILTQGRVATKLVTIVPGRRIDQVRVDLINDGFSPASVDNALQPIHYAGMAALADKPATANLEGLLYPDSFQRTQETDPTVIIRESLVEMGQHLTSDVQAGFAKEGLSTYQGITLASIVEQEVNKPNDQAQAAQVFLKRLSINMPLGSDVTAFYGAILAGQPPSVNFDSPYNTRLHPGLPSTPISNVNDQAIDAVINPAPTSWLYFVTGDDGTTYFSQTPDQQQANVAKYCHKLCAQTSQ